MTPNWRLHFKYLPNFIFHRKEFTSMAKNIAVVGGGYWGKNLVRNFHQIGALNTVCDADIERLAVFQEQYGVKTTPSFLDILSDPDIKGIALVTPAERHADMVKEALLAGKHVFVEKPLALDSSDGEGLVKLAKEKNRVLMVGHLLHYHGAVKKIKDLVSAGELGRVQYIYSNRLNLGKIRREENILWSFAPHDVSVILSLTEGEVPESLACSGGAYLHNRIADVTVSTMNFPSGVKAHIFVSWLHPYKEQKLVIVGDKKMAVFNDVEQKDKLLLYPHEIEWKQGMPVPVKAEAEVVDFERTEPLKDECRHFIECMETGKKPITDGEEGLRVLQVLQSLQKSLDKGGKTVTLLPSEGLSYMAHPTATVDDSCKIGLGTKIWHYSHISSGCEIGENCNIGQNVFIAPNVKTGNNVKIQNNVSLYEGVELGDDVFCGPSMVFTNVLNPRSHISRKHEYRKTRVGKGTTFGANCTIVCGHDIGDYAFIGAGAVVTKNVPSHALVVGNPAKKIGWMCRCGAKLPENLSCTECDLKYSKKNEILSVLQ